MLALDESRAIAPRRVCPSPASVPRVRTLAVRPHEVARRRPAGRFVKYGPAVAAPRPTPPPSRPAPSLLRVRARVAVACALLLVVAAGAVCGLASLAGSEAAAVPVQTGVVQVHQGETLSELAARVAPGAPSSEVVQRIVQLNALSGVSVRAGQTLVVPLREHSAR